MPRSSSLSSVTSALARPVRVLVVDTQPQFHQLISRCARGSALQVLHAATLAEARKQLGLGTVDLMLLESHMPDGNAVDMAEQCHRAHAHVEMIITSETPTLTEAIQALRAGAGDYLPKPLNESQVRERLAQAAQRHQARRDDQRRLRRLKQTCRKLNDMRKSVSEQVDILCADLVTAYQELADQMHQVVQTREFATILRDELDLEQVLRKTLEFLLDKAGSTNAVIFLPSTTDDYTTAGYVNYDCSGDSADMLLDHLADVVAPKLAGTTDLTHITDHDALQTWIGDDAAYLADYELLGFSANHKQEALAVVLLFRDKTDSFDPALCETCRAIAPLLGDYLAKLIRIHHRCVEHEDQDWLSGEDQG